MEQPEFIAKQKALFEPPTYLVPTRYPDTDDARIEKLEMELAQLKALCQKLENGLNHLSDLVGI